MKVDSIRAPSTPSMHISITRVPLKVKGISTYRDLTLKIGLFKITITISVSLFPLNLQLV